MVWGFPCGSASKESACSAGDLDLIPGLGRSPGEGNGYPLQYSGLENSMDCISPRGHKELDMTERLSNIYNLGGVVLGLCCCMQAFSNCNERGLLFFLMVLTVVASLAMEHRL